MLVQTAAAVNIRELRYVPLDECVMCGNVTEVTELVDDICFDCYRDLTAGDDDDAISSSIAGGLRCSTCHCRMDVEDIGREACMACRWGLR